MKRKITVFIFTLLSIQMYCQLKSGYEISVTVSGLKDSTIFLAYHFGDKQYITDTVILDKNGYGNFTGQETLAQGIYMIVLPGKKYFEILVSEDQRFAVSCAYRDYFNTLKFSGSEINNDFIEYQKKWSVMQQTASANVKRLQSNKQNKDSVRILTARQNILEADMKTYLRRVASDNQTNLLGILVKSMIPIEVPDFQVPSAVKNPDSVRWIKRYMYNKDHFFDNIDLTDDRLLRTPILQARLDAFFGNVVIQSADSINKEIDRLIRKCESNPKVFQFISVYLFNHFRESEIMGHDAVLVKLADDIYLSGKADWISKEFKEDLQKQVELLRHNLIGMKAENLVMDSDKGIFVSLYDIEKEFTILYFWEPDCGFCKEYTPKLRDYYNKSRNNGVEVFAICTISDKAAWSKYIEDNKLSWINGWDPARSTHFDFYYNVQSTPMVYILDRNKKIIAKKISVDDIPSFIDSYRKYYR
ncbi:MAG: redoxin domain-containing protein [Bacteroidales bacterium]|nr:redoxin domain-containing protein [Bacteroidales bacterium]